MVPTDDLDLSRCTEDQQNWLIKYQLKLPASFTLADVSPYCSLFFRFNMLSGALFESSLEYSVGTDSVFQDIDPAEQGNSFLTSELLLYFFALEAEDSSDPLNQGMLEGSSQSGSDISIISPYPAGHSFSEHFARADLSPADFQAINLILDSLFDESFLLGTYRQGFKESIADPQSIRR